MGVIYQVLLCTILGWYCNWLALFLGYDSLLNNINGTYTLLSTIAIYFFCGSLDGYMCVFQLFFLDKVVPLYLALCLSSDVKIELVKAYSIRSVTMLWSILINVKYICYYSLYSDQYNIIVAANNYIILIFLCNTTINLVGIILNEFIHNCMRSTRCTRQL